MSSIRQGLSTLSAALLIVVALSLSGCATLHSGAENESAFTPDWSGAVRMPESKSELSGLSEKSREIERKLGFE